MSPREWTTFHEVLAYSATGLVLAIGITALLARLAGYIN